MFKSSPSPQIRNYLTLTTLGMLGVYLTGCSEKKSNLFTEPPPHPVTAATAITKDVPLYIDTLGEASAFESVNIVSQVDGQIVNIAFEQGTMVEPGEKLIEIYKPPYEAALLQAQGALGQAEAELAINVLELERSRPLVPQKLISEQDFENLEATVTKNEAAIESAMGEVLAAEVNLGYTDIIAPVGGLIGIYEINIGNVVNASTETTLTSIQSLDPLYIDFIVSITHFDSVRKYYYESGDQLKIKATSLTDPTRHRNATMNVIGNSVNSSTGTVLLRATMDNKNYLFWPNQPLAIRIYLTTIKNAVLVPEAAVSIGKNGRFVFIIDKDNKVKQQAVVTGQEQDGNMLVIKSGLEAGQKVVIDGHLFLRTSMSVIITELDGKKIKTKTAPKKDNS